MGFKDMRCYSIHASCRRGFIFFARTAPDVKPWLDKDAIIS
jgi:hypothetical protein